MNDKFFVGLKLTALQDNGIRKPVSRVTLLVDDDNALTAGDDTGTELVADCPHATQEMVNSLLAGLKGYQYRAYRADDTSIDPSAELGDGVTVGGIYSIVSQISEDGSGYSGLTAPGEAELEDEYPSGGPMTQSFNRKIATTRSMITKTASQIRLEVVDEINQVYTSIDVTVGEINSTITEKTGKLSSEITQTAKDINTRIDNEVEGLSSSISQTAESLTAKINDDVGKLSAEIEVTAESLTTKINDDVGGLSAEIKVTTDSLAASISSTDGRVTSLTADLDKIESRVEDAEGNISILKQTATSLQSQINNNEGDISTLTQTANSLQTQVTNNKNSISSVKQYAESITLSVSNGSTSSTVTLKAGNTTLSSQTITMNGLVTFTGLANGTTTIDGACIKTGYISANRLDLYGAITFSDLSSSVQNDINDAYSMAVNAQNAANDVEDVVSGWTYEGSTYIDGSRIMTGTVMASQLLGGTVGLLDYRGNWIGGIEITDTSTGYGIELYSDTGGLRIAAADNFWVDAQNGIYSIGLTDSGFVCSANAVPHTDSRFDLGSSYLGLYWEDLYIVNDPSVQSDRNKKKDILYDLGIYDSFFDLLRPVSYRLKRGSSGRNHIGLIAQDVEQALEAAGLSSIEFAGFIKSPRMDDTGQTIEGEYSYALRYGEFISMLIDQTQKLKKRVAALESAGGML